MIYQFLLTRFICVTSNIVITPWTEFEGAYRGHHMVDGWSYVKKWSVLLLLFKGDVNENLVLIIAMNLMKFRCFPYTAVWFTICRPFYTQALVVIIIMEVCGRNYFLSFNWNAVKFCAHNYLERYMFLRSFLLIWTVSELKCAPLT